MANSGQQSGRVSPLRSETLSAVSYSKARKYVDTWICGFSYPAGEVS